MPFILFHSQSLRFRPLTAGSELVPAGSRDPCRAAPGCPPCPARLAGARPERSWAPGTLPEAARASPRAGQGSPQPTGHGRSGPRWERSPPRRSAPGGRLGKGAHAGPWRAEPGPARAGSRRPTAEDRRPTRCGRCRGRLVPRGRSSEGVARGGGALRARHAPRSLEAPLPGACIVGRCWPDLRAEACGRDPPGSGSRQTEPPGLLVPGPGRCVRSSRLGNGRPASTRSLARSLAPRGL